MIWLKDDFPVPCPDWASETYHKGRFPLAGELHNLYMPTHMNLTHVNKTEAMYGG